MLQKYRAQINPYKERVTKSSTELWKIAQFVEKRCNYARPMRQTICKVITKEAQLSQKDRATHYVRWNLVDCYTAVRKIPFQKACNHCLHSVVNANTKANRKGQISTPVASKSLNGFRWNLEYMTMSRVRLHTQIHVELRQRGWSGRAHDMSYVGFLVSLYFYHYPHMPIGKEWIIVYCLLFLYFLFVRLRISPPTIKLAASNFAQRFIGVQGRESHIWGTLLPQKPEIGPIGQREHWTINRTGRSPVMGVATSREPF